MNTTRARRATRTTPVATAHGIVRFARHHLSLTGARTVHTPQVTATAAALQATVTEQGLMCLAAPAGAGKTFTLHTVLDQHPAWHAVRLLPQPQARPADLRHSLHRARDLPGRPPKDPGTSDDLIRHTLHHPLRLLAVDEAHQLSASCLEYLRYLYDDPHTRIALVLASGSHRLRALRTTAMLASRVTCWHDLHRHPRLPPLLEDHRPGPARRPRPEMGPRQLPPLGHPHPPRHHPARPHRPRRTPCPPHPPPGDAVTPHPPPSPPRPEGPHHDSEWSPTWPPRRDLTLSPITIVVTQRDEQDYMRLAFAAHQPRHGRLTVHPTPLARNGPYLAHDLIRALGKHLPLPDDDHDLPGWATHTDRSWRITAA
ncbi:ATP-binding protein [Streptomyces murinus]|uniref:ATP-binding protein n=1 Tax=Streptomyces murinus TaxID=33900 RepID=UPI00382F778C